MDEQAVVGGSEGSTLPAMVGLNMGLVQLWVKSKANNKKLKVTQTKNVSCSHNKKFRGKWLLGYS